MTRQEAHENLVSVILKGEPEEVFCLEGYEELNVPCFFDDEDEEFLPGDPLTEILYDLGLSQELPVRVRKGIVREVQDSGELEMLIDPI